MISIDRISRLDAEDIVSRSPAVGEAGAVKALDDCARLSTVMWEGRVDGVAACAWGLIPPTLLSEQAYLWLITTDLVEEHKFLFIRASQMMVDVMLNEYPTIVGHTLAENTRAVRWLKWLGAQFDHDRDGRMSFVIRKQNNG